ncbi:hypothetical protein [Corynebacterium guaraldiae]|uniref:hypothetical protein n=1 Tax=Corynebacterium guaraldiae TaxID=3051103 RepID=UPI0020957237|nr:hypothetical protein [Corynebacterium guaraldiae]
MTIAVGGRLAEEESPSDRHDDKEDDGAPPAVSRGHLTLSHAQRAHPHPAHADECCADGQQKKHTGHGQITPPGQQNLRQRNGAHLEVQLVKTGAMSWLISRRARCQ